MLEPPDWVGQAVAGVLPGLAGGAVGVGDGLGVAAGLAVAVGGAAVGGGVAVRVTVGEGVGDGGVTDAEQAPTTVTAMDTNSAP